MKHRTKLALVVALAMSSGGAMAQMSEMKDMTMKQMPMGQSQGQVHKATGTVKKIDAAKGAITFAHGPVESIGWPSMTMGFLVKDKSLLEGLAVGRQVAFEFVKEGSAYVVTAVR